ncbi:hypothetical protein BH18ACT4_BH18ACT4_02180 [soil metagenome]
MDSDRADLSSVATALDDLTTRVTEVADRYNGTARDDLAADLYEVERALRTAARRLARVVSDLD